MKQFRMAAAALGLVVSLCGRAATADSPGPSGRYAAMAPVSAYLATPQGAEVSLARSAAPDAISRAADILVLGPAGYSKVIHGTNGFVCLVERSWNAGFDSLEFWNPKIRAPICYNPPAAASVLQAYLQRTSWVLSGATKDKMFARVRKATAGRRRRFPLSGAMSYMMSKAGYLSDEAGGPVGPHIMIYQMPADPSQWGANLPGSPIAAYTGSTPPMTIFFVPMAQWSDGTPAGLHTDQHSHVAPDGAVR